MKQLVQSARSGEQTVVEVPLPQAGPGQVLVRTAASLVSAGTERMAMEFARKNLVQKAAARPDLVRQVVTKARTEGVLTALDTALNRLDQPQSLGYSCAGTVLAVGEGVSGFAPGDRVSCAGAGFAVHAEFVAVPKNLVARVPAGGREISLEEAAFATVGAIALHGLRLAETQLGETVAVIGLGLIGLLAVQLARAAGCVVLGTDPDASRCRLAEELGCAAAFSDAEHFRGAIQSHSANRGADAVLVAAASESDGPVELAGEVARARGRVVAIGAVGTRLPRRLYYDKELDFRISRSYGPGRYDPEFEERGHDYPAAYVRWTETRNLEAFLQMLSDARIQVAPLISHRFAIASATEAYDLIGGRTGQPFLGVLITYPQDANPSRTIRLAPSAAPATDKVTVGLLGAGAFARGVLLPALRQVRGVEMAGVCAATGVSARHAAGKFGFRYCTSDEAEILADAGVRAVFIATRHHLHARQIAAAMQAGKDVFCEKPLAITEPELDDLLETVRRSGRMLMVGFNRRFAPLALQMKRFFSAVQVPMTVHYRVNAGMIPPTHWTQDPLQGGGRIVGEVCHFVDFAGWMLGSLPKTVEAQALPGDHAVTPDNVLISLQYEDGSVAQITYLANGGKALGKERVEVHGGGQSAVLEDFRRLELVTGSRRQVRRSWLRQDKGHRAECEAFVTALRKGSAWPIPLEDMVATTRATFRAVESLRTGRRLPVQPGAPG